ARTEEALEAGMFLLGCTYNFCWEHPSPSSRGRGGRGPEVAGSHAGDGGRADGSSVDDDGVAEPSRPAPTPGSPPSVVDDLPSRRISRKALWRHDHGCLWSYRLTLR